MFRVLENGKPAILVPNPNGIWSNCEFKTIEEAAKYLQDWIGSIVLYPSLSKIVQIYKETGKFEINVSMIEEKNIISIEEFYSDEDFVPAFKKLQEFMKSSTLEDEDGYFMQTPDTITITDSGNLCINYRYDGLYQITSLSEATKIIYDFLKARGN